MLILLLVPLLLVTAYAGCCVLLYAKQRAFLYFPMPRRLGPTQFAGTYQCGATLLQLTTRPHPGPGAVLYFGGSAEDVSGSLGAMLAAFPERAIVMLHYRGFGGSAGKCTEADLAADAAGLFDDVHARHPDVIVIGRSLGTGVAARLASTRPVARLVLVTPFDSMLDITQRAFPLFPARWLLIDKYESWRYVAGITAPVLILRAERDEVFPAESTEKLGARFPAGQAQTVVFAGASHDSIIEDPLYPRALAAFAARP